MRSATNLDSTSVTEGESPGPRNPLDLVDGVEPVGRVVVAHAPGEEAHAADGAGNGAAEGLDGRAADVLVGGSRALETRYNHVGLQDGSLQVHVVVVERLVKAG